MPDLPNEDGKSGVSPVPTEASLQNSDLVRRAAKVFLRQMFAGRPYIQESFHKICADGFPTEEFGVLLYSTCSICAYRSGPRHYQTGRKLLANSGDISKAQLKALPKKLRVMADMIDKLNATVFAPAVELKLMASAPNMKLTPDEARKKAARDYMIRRYETLAGLLRVYSFHVERQQKSARQMGKRLTVGKLHAIGLVRGVENSTGAPHYTEMSALLELGWRLAAGTENAPSFLSVEGLTKLYQRWANSICGPRCALR
jgi:hypothetical protein